MVIQEEKIKKAVICRVRMSKVSRQKTITIPSSCKNIKEGDYVRVFKMELL